ncbi:ankyrin repeat domain-containing protein [Arenibacter sp. GZD96]|uniref:ankyrin repeat domain-containing protein n=1 Tax=Aurantibrevibacter litoralis TaxID=3106030 RepID=UPI002AFEBB17|nr:ankyrin repeat domain-containing protein [Arenibacter sp. GZD-96]MEA1785636.1 ankyrin repeat domain-containing protein [Arenibacter sp. GZD-96]
MSALKEAVFSKDSAKIEALIASDNQIFKGLRDFDQRQITSALVRQKQYNILLQICDSRAVTLDLYEMDKLEGSFVETVLSNILFYSEPVTRFNAEKVLEERPDEEGITFLKSFVSKIENSNENVGNQSLLKLAILKKLPLEAFQIFINTGCSANETDASENTLLHLDILPHYAEILIRNGANINQKNKAGKTPLENAIENNNLAVVRLFLDNGADLSVKNKEGNSMFYVALVDKVLYEMYDLICDYGFPNFDEPNTEGTILLYDYIRHIDTYSSASSYEYLKKLGAQGANVMTSCTYYGRPTTPLDLAITKHFQVFEIVMDTYFEDINSTDNQGNTLLHKLCAVNLNFDAEKARELYKKVKFVLEKGADATIRNSQDKLPHELAMDDNLKEKIASLLLKQ